MLRTPMVVAASAVLLAAAGPAQAGAPLWLRMVHWLSGDSDHTDVPISMMGPHMQMSRHGPARPGDRERAVAIVTAARDVLRRYPDVRAAEHAGYRPFSQTGRLGEEVHYTSVRWAAAEGNRVDYAHPGSLLFRRTELGLEPVGVMYGAKPQAGPDELDARAPLSVAVWHRHVDFCWATTRGRERENDGPRFGYSGSIHDEATCKAERGYWLPLAFGWMTHVYPGHADPFGGGEHMDPAAGDAHAHHHD